MDTHFLHTEQELFSLIATGDEAAFRQVFHQYNKRLYPFILSIVKLEADAKEVIQEVFIKLWLHRAKLPEIENPGGWLHTVAANAAYDFLRSQARYEMRLAAVGPQVPEPAHMERMELNNLVREAMKQLPLRRRQVFQLIKLEGYSRKEAAEQLGISENTVRNQLGEAMEFVERYLSGHELLTLVPLSIFLLTMP